MDLLEVIDSFRADAIAREGVRATVLGAVAGLCLTGLVALIIWVGADLDSAACFIALATGIASMIAIYAPNFGMFSIAKVSQRLERAGVTPAPEVSFGRMDSLLRRLWLLGWALGAFEGAILLVLAVTH